MKSDKLMINDVEETALPYIEILRVRDGRDGHDGQPGPRGPPGRDGKVGPQGEKGEMGELLDPKLKESLMSGGIELPACPNTIGTELVYMLDELLELTTVIKEELMITSVYQRSLST